MDSHSSKKQVVFNFNSNEESINKDDSEINNEKAKCNEEVNCELKLKTFKPEADKDKIKEKDNNSENDTSLNHIKKIDVYDRLNFKRIMVKRNSRKVKTEICPKMNFTIEKFTDEIVKITEELTINNRVSDINEDEPLTRSNNKKRTIRFNNKKVTYQYPKEKEALNILNADDCSPSAYTTDDGDDEKEVTINFNFNIDEDNDH
jgi:hypothetical protein